MVQIKGPEDAVGLVIHLDRNQRPREDQWGQKLPAEKLRV